MLALVVTLLVLASAPVFDRLLQGRARAEAFVDGLIVVVVAGILLVHVLPFGLAVAGWPAALALATGALVGALAHRLPAGRGPVEGLAVTALLLHALLDGAGLAGSDEPAAELLAEAVILHSLPVGLATWRISRQRLGVPAAIALLVATGLATAAGWHTAGQAIVANHVAGLGLLQCAVAGALLHVLAHLGEGESVRHSGMGALVGAGIVAAITFSHPLPQQHAGAMGAGEVFLALALRGAPWLLGGYLLTALSQALPAPRLNRSSGLLAALRGAVLGLRVPVSSCEAPALSQLMLNGGASPSFSLAFLASGPSLSVSALLLSYALLGPDATGVRLVAAAGLGVLAGLVAGPLVPREREGPPALHVAPTRLRLMAGLNEAVEHTAPWVLAGLGLAAIAAPMLSDDALVGLPGPAVVVAAAVLGIPAYVCATGATPLIALLLSKGLSGGAALAFLLAGPAASAAGLRALRRRVGQRPTLVYALTVGLAAAGIGLVLDRPGLFAVTLSPADRDPLAVGSALVLLVLFAASLLRNGPRGFIEPLLHPHTGEDPEHPHDHGHSHDHDHGHAHDHR